MGCAPMKRLTDAWLGDSMKCLKGSFFSAPQRLCASHSPSSNRMDVGLTMSMR